MGLPLSGSTSLWPAVFHLAVLILSGIVGNSMMAHAYVILAFYALSIRTNKNILNYFTVPMLATYPTIAVGYMAYITMMDNKKHEKSVDGIPVLRELSRWAIFQAMFTYEVEFITPSRADECGLFDFTDDRLDGKSLDELLGGKDKTHNMRILGVLVGIGLILNILLGAPGIVLFVVVIVLAKSTPYSDVPDNWHVNNSSRGDFAGPNGLYRVYRNGYFSPRCAVGTAYSHEGVLQSRLHVVGNVPKPVSYSGREVGAFFHNEHLDCISWGGAPTYKTPRAGAKVVVELLPLRQDSTVVYTTTAERTKSGDVLFKGLITQGGVSGSPYFLAEMEYDSKREEMIEVLKFAGCIGENYKHDASTMMTAAGMKWQAEIIHNGGEMEASKAVHIAPGGSYQIISHPGSGKTRRVAAVATSDALAFCNNVILAGPTRVVANEMYRALRDSFDKVSLNIKGSQHVNRYAKVIITTHAALLTMIHNNDTCIKQSSGYIIDESHFANSRTMMLLTFLRNKFSKPDAKGMYLEMTATGFDMQKQTPLMSDGTNFPVEEIPYDGEVEKCVIRVATANPGKRILVFCPKVSGKESVKALATTLARSSVSHKVIQLYREVYNTRAAMASDMNAYPTGVIILTTNLSECGANYNIDIVIDTCKQMRCMETSPGVYRMCTTPITLSQYIQRKGRTGRRREGVYYYPLTFDKGNVPALYYDTEVERKDAAYYQNHYDMRDEYGERSGDSANASDAQMRIWVTSLNDNMPANIETLKLLYRHNGAKCSIAQTTDLVRQRLLKSNGIPVTLSGKVIRVAWWDDRDGKILTELVRRATGDTTITTETEYDAEILAPTIKVSKYVLERNTTYDDPDAVADGIPMVMRPMLPRHVRVGSDWLGRRKLEIEEESEDDMEGTH